MEMRDKAEARVREGEAWIPFHDFSAFNEVLDDAERTKALFSWLHVNRRSDAVAVFPITLPALIRLGQYALCAEFVNPIEDRERMFETFNAMTRLAAENYDGDAQDELRDFAEKKLVNEAATLVGILAQAGRGIEARDAAEMLLRQNLLPELAFAVEAALEGHCRPRIHSCPPRRNRERLSVLAIGDRRQWVDKTHPLSQNRYRPAVSQEQTFRVVPQSRQPQHSCGIRRGPVGDKFE